MKAIRVGIAGMGIMGKRYYEILQSLSGIRITALCNRNRASLKAFQEPVFTDYRELIASGTTDCLLIVTPHPSHAPIAMAALKAGIPVLTDKPMASNLDQARAMHDCAVQTGLPLGVIFQLRQTPVYRHIKYLLDRKALGTLQRFQWTATNMFRPHAYYRLSGWRATWQGEGGGVLINQCPHLLDVLQWYFGMPGRITAVLGLGSRHPVEVDDAVTAVLEYPKGLTGVFIASTGEAPGTNRLEIAGSLGKLVLEGDTLTLLKNKTDSQTYCKTAFEPFGAPPVRPPETKRFPPETDENRIHAAVFENFFGHLQGKSRPAVPSGEGLKSLELSNAMHVSGLTGKPVNLPLEPGRFQSVVPESQGTPS